MAIPDGHWSPGNEATADRLNTSLVQADIIANRPAAVGANKGMYYFATDSKSISYSDGSDWQIIRGAMTESDIAPGASDGNDGDYWVEY